MGLGKPEVRAALASTTESLMTELEQTLAYLAPGVTYNRELPGRYNPRHGLAIYSLPVSGYSPTSPGVVLGEALATRSGLGCTMLEGIPTKIPEGAVVIAEYNSLAKMRPDLLQDVPELGKTGQYAIKLQRHALVTSLTREGLASGMQTLAMLILRHSEDTLPGSLVVDIPFCQSRGLAVELQTSEISINLLMQMVSFAATFKANRLQLILQDDFDPAREIPGIETFAATCESYGIEIGVRLPWLGRILSGAKSIFETWTALRAAARAFGASHAALDDTCPTTADAGICQRIVDSLLNGEVGLRDFSLDAAVFLRAEYPARKLAEMGIWGWHRLRDDTEPPLAELAESVPIRLDVQAPLPGFSSASLSGYHDRLDAAAGWLRKRDGKRELIVSFRDIGVSHMWQNLLYPAATGMITAWGRPDDANQSALLFSNLLYGEAAPEVMNMWNAATQSFPPGLSPKEEILVRRTAFGQWPEEEEDIAVLTGIDWLAVTKHIKNAAETLRQVASTLNRNASTLTGARLSLHALSWLHCFMALTPELELRRRNKYDDDGRTEPIASELYSNFLAWQENLQALASESGLEVSELPLVESMGLRLKGLCEGIFE